MNLDPIALRLLSGLPHPGACACVDDRAARKMLNSLLLAAAAAAAATAAVEEAPEVCGFTTEPVEKDLGQGFRSWVWTEPYRPGLFADGLLLEDKRFKKYKTWLGKTIPRDFGGLDPFNQTACLIHQRGIFKGTDC